jgi:uncharacterized protein (DUF1778 family)
MRLPRSALQPHAAIRGVSRKEWTFTLEAALPDGTSQMLAQAHVILDEHGRPLSGPELAIDKRVTIDGSELRIDIDGVSSLTDFTLEAASRQFEQNFGHPPTELPGSLADDNKAIFRRAYVAELDKGATPQVAANRAASQTPFVIARVRRKYTDIEVRPSGSVRVTIGDPPRVRNVPEKVIVITRRKP